MGMAAALVSSDKPETKASRRARIAGTLDMLGLLDRLLWLRARLGAPILTVLTYHRIAERTEVGELDADVRETDPRGFAEQIAMIKAHSTIVSLADVRASLKTRRRLPPNAVMLAFDDGYVDCHEVALPILKKASAPATFFVPTAYPDSGKMFWWDRIALLLKRCRARSISLRYPLPITLDLEKTKDQVKRSLLKIVKHTPRLDLARFMDALERATEVSIDAAEEKEISAKTIMSWQKIRSLRDAGMTIASHSHAHRVLTNLSPAEALADLCASKRLLTEVLNEDVKTIAYPIGYRLTGPYLRAVMDARFDLGFTNAAGLGLLGHEEPLNMPRCAVSEEDVGALYKWLLLVGQRPHWAQKTAPPRNTLS